MGKCKPVILMILALSLGFAPALSADEARDREIHSLKEQMETLNRQIHLLQDRLRRLEARPSPETAEAEGTTGRLVMTDSISTAPSDKFEFYGQVRGRYEYRTNPAFLDTGSEDQDVALLRTRLGAKIHIQDGLSADILFQDSRAFGEEVSTISDEEGVDLKKATIDWTGVADGAVDFHLGRQVLAYGGQKLIGGLEWVNSSRSFDAFRTVFHGWDGKWQADLFAAVLDENFGGDDDETFYGFYNSLRLGEKENHILEPYLLLRRNGDGAAFPGGGSLEEYTLGVRSTAKWTHWAYAFEGAYQFGDRGDLDVDAYALHGLVSYSWERDCNPLLFLEANLGSGDDDPDDGDWGRFDNLFPTNHKHYGYADYFSWTNLEHWRLGFVFEPYDRGRLAFDLHKFNLETTSDAWFNAGGSVVRGAAPGADDDAGWEFDITWRHIFPKGLGVLVGYSYFEPGDFASATGSDDEVQFFYVQSQLNF